MPNRAKEKFSGVGGVVLMAPWVFQGVLRVWDWAGRAQTAMTIAPHLGVLSTPLAFLTELLGVSGLLFYATTLEHQREADETPRIIQAWSEPEKPKRHWFWIKVAIGVALISLVAACITAYRIQMKIPVDDVLVRSAIRYPIPPVAKPATDHLPSAHTKEVASLNSPDAPKRDIVNLYLSIVDWQQHNPPAVGGVFPVYSAPQASEFHRRFDSKLESMADMLRGRGLQDQAHELQAAPSSAEPLHLTNVSQVMSGLKDAAAFF